MFNMTGYNIIYKIGKTKNGRVAIPLKDHLKYTSCDDPSVFKEGAFESVFTTWHFKKAVI